VKKSIKETNLGKKNKREFCTYLLINKPSQAKAKSYGQVLYLFSSF
jgi:hypothetical protein